MFPVLCPLIRFRKSSDNDECFTNGAQGVRALIEDLGYQGCIIMTNAYQFPIPIHKSLAMVDECFARLVPLYHSYLERGMRPTTQQVFIAVKGMAGFGDLVSLLVAGEKSM